jgi:uncharacterized protein YodC (DUF2158 family)
MASEIKVGEVVRLKSGGPMMTVKKVEQFNSVMSANCDWFEGSEPKYGMFPVTSLKVVEEESSAARSGRTGGAWS